MAMIVATLWGFAEATLFFIVPDVWLSLIAVRRGLTPAIIACGFALAGALVGGAIMYGWGAVDIGTAREALDWVPSIDKGMMKDVRSALRHDGVEALFFGPLAGTPYKVYAVEASAAGIGPAAFLSVSIPARLIRFAVVVAAAWTISLALERYTSRFTRTLILLAVWAIFYAVYLSVFPN